ncbi:MAG: hypothetical protein ACOC8H_00560 [bacterium]
MATNIPAALRQLSASLARLRELLAWAELSVLENQRNGIDSFRFTDHFPEEIRMEYAGFLATALAVQELLNDPQSELSADKKRRWQRRLDELQAELAALSGIERFISPR